MFDFILDLRIVWVVRCGRWIPTVWGSLDEARMDIALIRAEGYRAWLYPKLMRGTKFGKMKELSGGRDE